jgi:ABC-type hemin transport system ATPase subunit
LDRLLLPAGGSAVKVATSEEVLQEPVLEAVYGCWVMVDKHPATRRLTVSVLWPDGR